MSGDQMKPKRYILPLTTINDHSSAAQLEDWKSLLQNIFKVASPISSKQNFGVEQWRDCHSFKEDCATKTQNLNEGLLLNINGLEWTSDTEGKEVLLGLDSRRREQV
jgi:hypothetical protein